MSVIWEKPEEEKRGKEDVESIQSMSSGSSDVGEEGELQKLARGLGYPCFTGPCMLCGVLVQSP